MFNDVVVLNFDFNLDRQIKERVSLAYLKNEILENKEMASMDFDLFYSYFINETTPEHFKNLYNLCAEKWKNSVKNIKFFDNYNKIDINLDKVEMTYPTNETNISKLKIETFSDFAKRNENKHILCSSTAKEINKKIIVESPFAGKIEENIAYLTQAINHLIHYENVAPFASHLIYTRILDDKNIEERKYGINAGLKIGELADESYILVDRGLSNGMKYGILDAVKNKRPYKLYTIQKNENLITELNEINKNISATIVEDFFNKKQESKKFKETGFI